MSSLADLIKTPASSRLIELYARPNNNLGYTTVNTTLDVGTFLFQSQVGNKPDEGQVTQRPLSPGHATLMSAFNLSALISYTAFVWEAGGQVIPDEVKSVLEHVSARSIYGYAPLVCSVRCDFSHIKADLLSTGEYCIKLRPDQIMWVVDGQHRRKGLEFTRDWLSKITTEAKYPRVKDAFPVGLTNVGNEAAAFWRLAQEKFLGEFTVSTEVYFGLSLDQERQLFYFLNDLGKEVKSAISQSFDKANPINNFTRSLVADMAWTNIVSDKGQVNWDDAEWLRYDSLNAINARLFLNASKIDHARSSQVVPRIPAAQAFWKAVAQIPNVTDRRLSLAAQPAMLKALAATYYTLLWSRGKGRKNLPSDTPEKFLAAITSLDFSHTNKVWQTAGGIKNVGSVHSDDTFRFSPTHNEIVPALVVALRRETNTL